MKKHIIILTLVISCFLCINVLAHTGGTDGNGGHYNRGTREYHYHHGHPAHQHENGTCPYINYETEQDKDSDTHTYTYSHFLGPTNSYNYYTNDYLSTEAESTTSVENTDNSSNVVLSRFLEILFGTFGCLLGSIALTLIITTLFGGFFPEKSYWKITIVLFAIILLVLLYITLKST